MLGWYINKSPQIGSTFVTKNDEMVLWIMQYMNMGRSSSADSTVSSMARSECSFLWRTLYVQTTSERTHKTWIPTNLAFTSHQLQKLTNHYHVCSGSEHPLFIGRKSVSIQFT
jgi:hypothetical protein